MALAVVSGAPGWLGTSLVQALAQGTRLRSLTAAPRRVRCLVHPAVSAAPLERLGPNVDIVRRRPPGRAVARRRVRRGDDRLPRGGARAPAPRAGAVQRQRRRHAEPPRRGDRGRGAALHPGQLELAGGPQRHPRAAHEPRTIRRGPISTTASPSSRPSGWSTMLTAPAASRAHRPALLVLRAQPAGAAVEVLPHDRGGKPIILGRGDNLRSMSYIDNVVQGLLLLAEVEKAAGKTYWITDRRPYSFIEIIETVAKLLEVEVRPRYLPTFGSDVARLVDSLLQMAGLYQQEKSTSPGSWRPPSPSPTTPPVATSATIPRSTSKRACAAQSPGARRTASRSEAVPGGMRAWRASW